MSIWYMQKVIIIKFSTKCWRRKWQPTPIILPGKSHGQRSLTGYSPWVPKRHDWATKYQFSDSTSDKRDVVEVILPSLPARSAKVAYPHLLSWEPHPKCSELTGNPPNLKRQCWKDYVRRSRRERQALSGPSPTVGPVNLNHNVWGSLDHLSH